MHRHTLTIVLISGLVLLGCLPLPVTADEIDELVAKIAKYEYGQDAGNLKKLDDLVAASHADPARRKQIAKKLADLLSTDATQAAKEFVCKQLWRIGSAEVVPTVSRLLDKTDTADMARYVLERMPDPAAGAALREALGKAQGTIKVGILNSLGERRDRKAAGAIAELITDANPVVAEAAVIALGRIGGQEAIGALTQAKRRAASGRVATMDEAMLLCAAGLAAEKDPKGAEFLYRALYGRNELPQTRAAALKGLVDVRQDGAVPLVLAAIDRDDAIVRTAAAEAIRGLKARDADQALAAALPKMKPHAQILLLDALADRGDRKVLGAVTAAAGSRNEDVRIAALQAIGKLGDASSVPVLAKAAAGGRGAEPAVARESLDGLKGAATDGAIIRAIGDSPARVKVELIRSLAARSATGALPTLWTTAVNPDESVRDESFKALGVLAGDKDLPKLLNLLVKEPADGPRAQAEAAALAVANRMKKADDRIAAAIAAFPSSARSPKARAGLIRILGKLQGDRALPLIRGALGSDQPAVRDAAIRALADWDTPAPMKELLDVAEKNKSKDLGRVALKGYLRMLAMPSDRPTAETLAMYKKALTLASSVEEKKTALDGLAGVADRGAVDLIKQFEKDKDLKAAVGAALKKIKERANKPSASHGGGSAGAALDGNLETRWSTGEPMKPGQWFMLDLGWESEIRKIVLDTTPSAGDYPRGYEVYVSNDPKNWGEPVAKGAGDKPVLEIQLKPKKGRYLRIVQTGSHDSNFWSIHELKVDTAK